MLELMAGSGVARVGHAGVPVSVATVPSGVSCVMIGVYRGDGSNRLAPLIRAGAHGDAIGGASAATRMGWWPSGDAGLCHARRDVEQG